MAKVQLRDGSSGGQAKGCGMGWISAIVSSYMQLPRLNGLCFVWTTVYEFFASGNLGQMHQEGFFSVKDLHACNINAHSWNLDLVV